MTNITFIFETSPNTIPKEKKGGTWHTTSPHLKKWWGHVPRVPHQIAPILRPNAIWCDYRRLAAKVCLRPFIPRLRELLLPSQVGIGIPLACEAAVHATRYFMDQPHSENVLLKLDVKNVFNSIRRDTVLQEAQKHLPETHPFVWDYYSSKTTCFHGNGSLDSATGVQQGDPLGPALFALAIHEVTSKVTADLNVLYLNDRCVSGDPQTVLGKATTIRIGLFSLDLEINVSKFLNHTITNKHQASKLFQDQFPSISTTEPSHWQLLGSPLHQESSPLHLKTKPKFQTASLKTSS